MTHLVGQVDLVLWDCRTRILIILVAVQRLTLLRTVLNANSWFQDGLFRILQLRKEDVWIVQILRIMSAKVPILIYSWYDFLELTLSVAVDWNHAHGYYSPNEYKEAKKVCAPPIVVHSVVSYLWVASHCERLNFFLVLFSSRKPLRRLFLQGLLD